MELLRWVSLLSPWTLYQLSTPAHLRDIVSRKLRKLVMPSSKLALNAGVSQFQTQTKSNCTILLHLITHGVIPITGFLLTTLSFPIGAELPKVTAVA